MTDSAIDPLDLPKPASALPPITSEAAWDLTHHQEAPVDAFGLHDALLGPHPEEFYAAVGRQILVTAVLEDRLKHLAARLSGDEPSPMRGLADQISKCRVYGDRLPDGGRLALDRVLDAAEEARVLRNDAAHNLWPAQDGDRTFGWREGKFPQVKCTEGTMDTWKAAIARTSLAAMEANDIFVRAQIWIQD